MRYTIRDFLPLIIIFILIITFTATRQFVAGTSWSVMNAMNDFMAGFFLVFGAFKIINWRGFVQAYKIYDLLAKQSTAYAYAYPIIELALGLAYFFRIYPIAINSITFVLMIMSSIGVALELTKGGHIICACLGAVFKLPMTYVTLFEDLLMAGMALGMLLYLLV